MSATLEDFDFSAPVTFEAGGQAITVERDILPGQPMTAQQAIVLFNATVRQFKAKEDKSYADRLAGKNKTPQPTAEELATAFTVYEIKPHDITGTSAVEKMNHDAAWRTAAAMFAEHNAAVAAGDKSPWFKIAGEIVPPTRAYTENGQKITVADFRNHWVNVVLTAKSAKVQAKFAATLEAIKAETGKGKPEKPSSAVALGSISLDDDDDTAED